VRSVLYRFPDLDDFDRLVQGAVADAELGLPPGEGIDDGEWVLAIFELGPARRATSAAARGAASPDGARLVFEPRDVKRLAHFASHEARSASAVFAPPELTPETTRSPGSPASPDLPPANPRVLIVDDDPDIRDVVSAMLEAVGLSVSTTDSGESALERVVAEAFDLVVLDWNLPRMTGTDLCRAIRKDPALAALPVLFLTANASSQDMIEAFASGGDDFVTKPFRAPELGARIFSLLRRARKAG
jgi:two-component system, OmpR family, phosphate regulon response regulator PhoB